MDVTGLLFTHVAYLAAVLLFVLGLRRLQRVKTARTGNLMAAGGMALAVITTFTTIGVPSWEAIVPALIIGGGIGAFLARRVKLTGMPELVAFFNGMGGAASAVVALSVLFTFTLGGVAFETLAGGVHIPLVIYASILVGCVTLSGSVVAWAKLAGKIPGGSKKFLKGVKIGPLEGNEALSIGILLLTLIIALLGALAFTSDATQALSFIVIALLSLGLGVTLVMPIGGADMPVAISLLNSYSGIAASMSGFVLLASPRGGQSGYVLIISGALVGAAGLILTGLMCKAMNRSLLNVARGLGTDAGPGGGKEEYDQTRIKSGSAEEAAMMLDGAESVIFVPGYGLAVAQAQHVVAELAALLERQGTTVKYAIHPVAGRMPGHMNVLLAEADVPYEQLFALDDINSDFPRCNVAIIVGANDVVNPAALTDPTSPIAGMPILEAYKAQNVIMIKRSLSPGYAGIKNPLFEADNAMMFFSDAKAALQETVSEFKAL